MSVLQDLNDEECKLEMTPMIDVTFLLLIFFMLAGQLAKSPTVSVDTPLSQVLGMSKWILL